MTDDKPPSSAGPGEPGFWRRLRQRFSLRPRDREELESVLRDGQRRELFDRDAHGMLQGVLEVADTQVREVMVPRPHMVVIERDAPQNELLATVVKSGHSRFPVIGEDRDEVVGILLAKDLLRYFGEAGEENFALRDLLRPAVFVPESKRLNVLLKEFRASHNHMAIVVDEYGGVSGLATIEDVIEQIVGDIDDEHDIEDDVHIARENENDYTVLAVTRIDEFNEYFATNFDDEDYDTIGGLVMHHLGRVPRRGESLSFEKFKFSVLRCDRRRIEAVRVRRADVASETAA